MNITYACPHCDQANRQQLAADARLLCCAHCDHSVRLPDAAREQGRLHRCLVCPSVDLFVRKDFPQRLGVALVAIGVIGSSIAWGYTNVVLTFAILFATALIDVVLYLFVGDALMCYRCHAEYRSVEDMEQHGAFDLETHERYRQLGARLAGAANASANKL